MESIRIARKQRDMTLAQVAARTGLLVSFLSDLERGRTNPSLSSLRKLAPCYGVHVARLLEVPARMHYIEVVTRFNLHLQSASYFQNVHEIAQTQGFQ